MPTAKIHGTDHTLVTHRVKDGAYMVHRVTDEGEQRPEYRIVRSKYGGWDLFQRILFGGAEAWLQAAHGKDTIKVALRCAAARIEHDRLWADYQERRAHWENRKAKSKELRMRIPIPPRPETRKLDAETGKLWGPAIKMVAGRQTVNGWADMPTYRVFIDDDEIGFIYLLGAIWHVGGASEWYAGPNGDWTNFRHGGGDRDPEAVAAAFARGVMRIVIRRYTRQEIARRDAQVAEENERRASR